MTKEEVLTYLLNSNLEEVGEILYLLKNSNCFDRDLSEFSSGSETLFDNVYRENDAVIVLEYRGKLHLIKAFRKVFKIGLLDAKIRVDAMGIITGPFLLGYWNKDESKSIVIVLEECEVKAIAIPTTRLKTEI